LSGFQKKEKRWIRRWKEIENDLVDLFEGNVSSIFNEEERIKLKELERQKTKNLGLEGRRMVDEK
jgi:hypothetical protein